MNALSVEHPSYSSPDGKNTFQFNANVVISGSRNRMNGWTLKIVFSKPIINIKVRFEIGVIAITKLVCQKN